MNAFLEVEGLTVRFGEHTVVDGVSFTLDAGGRIGIIGESGSGKTLTALVADRAGARNGAGHRLGSLRRSTTTWSA